MKAEFLAEIARKSHRWRQGPQRVTRPLHSPGSSSGGPGPSQIPSPPNSRTTPSACKQRRQGIQAVSWLFAEPGESPCPVQAPSRPL